MLTQITALFSNNSVKVAFTLSEINTEYAERQKALSFVLSAQGF
ncbi:hypothetical protein GCHA_3099 [Paraglaciecola chathamensis S18K6]|jgi:hypothetical protein|uniref:Uncharacterized protein n=1 Tax=Paraglaciecola chathamensis S18K6 TaxID=1127672 RepID=A0AAV3V3C0_9ALTE|nr:hypothetical protein GCHA_3099 [Paraglaciecola chathamensis S18K6]